jgi:hypothetical protein
LVHKPLDDSAPDLERLTRQVKELERRVSALEQGQETASARPVEPEIRAANVPLPAAEPSPARPAGAIRVVGQSILGIAGAYLLRAAAESGSFPPLAVVAVALAYAGGWLVGATRVRADVRFASTAYGITAAFILSPMLWEVTVRFKFLPAAATAGALVAFVVLASALAWRRKLAPVVWVATSFAVITALALLIATRDLVPLTSALLLVALATEFAACRDHWLGLRPIAAVAADIAVWVLSDVSVRQQSISLDYKPIPAVVVLMLLSALFVIYSASAVFRSGVLRRAITFFEIAQLAAASLLVVVGVLRSNEALAPVLGIFFLLVAAACYWAAFAWFDRVKERRNYHVFATLSAAFLLAGSFLCLRPTALALCLSLAAIVATFVGVRTNNLTIRFHGMAYLAAAASVSGLLGYAGHALLGVLPSAPAWVFWTAAVSAVVCYIGGGSSATERWYQRLPRLLPAALTVYAAAALAVVAMDSFTPRGAMPDAARLAVIRTFVTCVAALSLGFSGTRWRRVELTWIAYLAVAFVTVKLLFEDLRCGSAGAVAVSLIVYAAVWILGPRLMRSRVRRA